jgi:hypothetical protein
VNEAQIVCALERYRLAHGAYPGMLDALIPQFIEKLPHDIIGGQPLIYHTTPDGKFLIVDIPAKKRVAVVDLGAMKVVKTLDVPASPQAVVVRPDGREAYVSCDSSHKIAVISVADWSVKGLIDASAGADGLAWAK